MLRKVQTRAFILNVYAQADQRVHNFEQNEGGTARKNRCDQHADGLVAQLAQAARERHRNTIAVKRGGNGGVDGRAGQAAEHQHADDAADAMHPKHI